MNQIDFVLVVFQYYGVSHKSCHWRHTPVICGRTAPNQCVRIFFFYSVTTEKLLLSGQAWIAASNVHVQFRRGFQDTSAHRVGMHAFTCVCLCFCVCVWDRRSERVTDAHMRVVYTGHAHRDWLPRSQISKNCLIFPFLSSLLCLHLLGVNEQ